MPSILDYDEIDLTGLEIDSVEWSASVLMSNYGDGYGDQAVVGSVNGLLRWKLSSGAWPDATSYGNLVNGLPRFQYYWEFFRSHTTGIQRIFVIEFRGKKYHADFVDTKINADMFTIDLFGGGVDIKQRRVSGFLYNDDGSIDTVPPGIPTLLSVTDINEYSALMRWTVVTDPPGQAYTLAGYEILLNETTIIDAGMGIAESMSVDTFTPGTLTPGTVYSFRVRSYDGATPHNASAWSNSLSATTPALPALTIIDDDGAIILDDDGLILVDA